MHILVVDDDLVVLQSCKKILESSGKTVTLTETVKEALKVIDQKASIDLVLVDIKMPEEDGLSLIEKLREKGIDIPILVMSGYPTEETIDTSLSTGAHDFIAKPFTPDELLNTIETILKGESRGTKKDPGNR
jgi:DNA-binding NtrC family response regulator